LNESLTTRIYSRLGELESITGGKFSLPPSHSFNGILNAYPSKRRLLHMDIRPLNMIFQSNRIEAVFDWTNACIGYPVLELMRIKDYGFLTDEYIQGYKGFSEEMRRVPLLVQNLYQLDTALMLTLHFSLLQKLMIN
jgi:aminoglycoside phosphotransferase (APT) family kinase protein